MITKKTMTCVCLLLLLTLFPFSSSFLNENEEERKNRDENENFLSSPLLSLTFYIFDASILVSTTDRPATELYKSVVVHQAGRRECTSLAITWIDWDLFTTWKMVVYLLSCCCCTYLVGGWPKFVQGKQKRTCNNWDILLSGRPGMGMFRKREENEYLQTCFQVPFLRANSWGRRG